MKTLTGKSFPILVKLDDTVADLKQKIHEKEDVPPCAQRIVHAGKQLDDDMTMAQSWIRRESILHLVGRLSGD
jgi:hypothetical protein